MSDHDLQRLADRLAPSTAQLNATELAKVFGYKTTWTLQAMKIAARATGDSPFRGHYATVNDVRKWLKAHPEFVASHHLRKTAPRRRDPNPPSPGVDKSDESSATHGPQTPSPAKSAPPPAPCA